MYPVAAAECITPQGVRANTQKNGVTDPSQVDKLDRGAYIQALKNTYKNYPGIKPTDIEAYCSQFSDINDLAIHVMYVMGLQYEDPNTRQKLLPKDRITELVNAELQGTSAEQVTQNSQPVTQAKKQGILSRVISYLAPRALIGGLAGAAVLLKLSPAFLSSLFGNSENMHDLSVIGSYLPFPSTIATIASVIILLTIKPLRSAIWYIIASPYYLGKLGYKLFSSSSKATPAKNQIQANTNKASTKAPAVQTQQTAPKKSIFSRIASFLGSKITLGAGILIGLSLAIVPQFLISNSQYVTDFLIAHPSILTIHDLLSDNPTMLFYMQVAGEVAAVLAPIFYIIFKPKAALSSPQQQLAASQRNLIISGIFTGVAAVGVVASLLLTAPAWFGIASGAAIIGIGATIYNYIKSARLKSAITAKPSQLAGQPTQGSGQTVTPANPAQSSSAQASTGTNQQAVATAAQQQLAASQRNLIISGIFTGVAALGVVASLLFTAPAWFGIASGAAIIGAGATIYNYIKSSIAKPSQLAGQPTQGSGQTVTPANPAQSSSAQASTGTNQQTANNAAQLTPEQQQKIAAYQKSLRNSEIFVGASTIVLAGLLLITAPAWVFLVATGITLAGVGTMLYNYYKLGKLRSPIIAKPSQPAGQPTPGNDQTVAPSQSNTGTDIQSQSETVQPAQGSVPAVTTITYLGKLYSIDEFKSTFPDKAIQADIYVQEKSKYIEILKTANPDLTPEQVDSYADVLAKDAAGIELTESERLLLIEARTALSDSMQGLNKRKPYDDPPGKEGKSRKLYLLLLALLLLIPLGSNNGHSSAVLNEVAKISAKNGVNQENTGTETNAGSNAVTDTGTNAVIGTVKVNAVTGTGTNTGSKGIIPAQVANPNPVQNIVDKTKTSNPTNNINNNNQVKPGFKPVENSTLIVNIK